MSDTNGTPVALAWSWPDALRGAVYAIPATVVTARNPGVGLPLAIGVLPACLLPMPPTRKTRIRLFVLGTTMGVSILMGGALGHLPHLATAVLLAGAVVLAAVACSRFRSGQIVLYLAAPLVAVGLSYGSDWARSMGAMLLLTLGACYAWLASLVWPERPTPEAVDPNRPGVSTMLRYGLSLGAGAAIAYLIASASDVDHPGWAPAACLLVARPVTGLLKTRAIGRILAVTLGAVLAIAVVNASLESLALAALAAGTVTAAAATRGSRWYVTSGFTTFLVFLMLLLPDPAQATQKLGERLTETILGVSLALVFGIVIPQALPSRIAAGRDTRSSEG